RSQFTTGAAFGIQNHGLPSLGNTIGAIVFRLSTQASQAAASCWMQMQEARQHGSPYLSVCHICPPHVPLIMRGCISVLSVPRHPYGAAVPILPRRARAVGVGDRGRTGGYCPHGAYPFAIHDDRGKATNRKPGQRWPTETRRAHGLLCPLGRR